MKLIAQCPTCGKARNEEREFKLLSTVFLFCGHKVEEKDLETKDQLDFFSLDGTCEAYEFQKENIRAAINSNCNCIIADAMGLGKTIQAALLLRNLPEVLLHLLLLSNLQPYTNG